ncbi:hypothetical protein KIL84_000466, partial [Mauremys mutica]
ETVTKHLEVIESTCQKLLLLEGKDWKHFPHSAQQEKEHQRLKKLTDKVATLLKMDIESRKQRFGDVTSQTQPPESEWKGFSSGRKIAMDPELQGHKERENIREQVSVKQQETASHVIHICEEAPDPKYGLDHASLDPGVHTISNTREDDEHKVDVKSLRSRFEKPMSPNPSVDSGGRKKDSVSPGGNVVTQPELPGHEEKGGQVSEEQKEAAPCVHKETQTPTLMRRHGFPSPSQMHKQVCHVTLQTITGSHPGGICKTLKVWDFPPNAEHETDPSLFGDLLAHHEHNQKETNSNKKNSLWSASRGHYQRRPNWHVRLQDFFISNKGQRYETASECPVASCAQLSSPDPKEWKDFSSEFGRVSEELSFVLSIETCHFSPCIVQKDPNVLGFLTERRRCMTRG